MAKKEGEVRIPSADRKFGFVGDAFISGRDLNALNLQAGDRAAYDEVPGQPGKGPKATNIAVVTRAAPQAAQTGPPVQTAQTTAGPVPTKQEKVSVEFMVVPAKESPQDKLTFRVAVFVHRGDDPLDKEVSLKANGQQVNDPAPILSTDPNGRALFQVSLDKNATECWLVAEIEGKSYSHLWEKDVQTDPLLPKRMIPSKLALKSAVQSRNWVEFELATTAGIDVQISSRGGSTLTIRKAGEDNWMTGKTNKVSSPGRLVIQAKLEKPAEGLSGDYVIFETEGADPVESYISGLYYQPTEKERKNHG